MQLHRNSGFTLLEALITVAVLSILVALAVPGFKEMMDRNAVVTTANGLLSSLLTARSEAVKRERIAVFSSGDNNFTSWKVEVDTDDPPDRKVDLEILNGAPTSNVSITTNGNAATIIYNPRGRPKVSNSSPPPPVSDLSPASDFFTITRNSTTRYLCFNTNGKPYLKDPANGACP